MVGIEPTTFGFQNRPSTNGLHSVIADARVELAIARL